jgi:hypothetical protein
MIYEHILVYYLNTIKWRITPDGEHAFKREIEFLRCLRLLNLLHKELF